MSKFAIYSVILLSFLLSSCRQLTRSRTDSSFLQKGVPSGQSDLCSIHLNAQSIFDRSKDSVAVVMTPEGYGSAFIVHQNNSETLLITNAHVVDKHSRVRLKWINKQITEGEVIANAGGTTPQQDLALIKTIAGRRKALILKQSNSSVGEDIVAIGAPKGLDFSLTRGVISSIRSQGDLLQIDAPINPGNSGGPVIDASGCVTGIATFKLDKSEGLNFAISAKIVQEYFTKYLSKPSTSVNLQPPGVQSAPNLRFPRSSNLPSNKYRCWIKESNSSIPQKAACAVKQLNDPRGIDAYRLTFGDSSSLTVILARDASAQTYSNGRRLDGQWSRSSNGELIIRLNNVQIGFRP